MNLLGVRTTLPVAGVIRPGTGGGSDASSGNLIDINWSGRCRPCKRLRENQPFGRLHSLEEKVN